MSTRTKTSPACGTYGGYQKHKRRGETACDECRAASAAYQRANREDPAVRRRHNQAMRATEAALRELARQHNDEYQALYAKHLTAIRQPTA